MRNDQEIIKKYPELFGTDVSNPRETLMSFGFEVSEFWLPAIEKMLEKLSTVIKRDGIEDFKIVQIKEKFGELRVYVRYFTDEIDAIIGEAEKECLTTCEKCGSLEGIFRGSGWLRVMCTKCEPIEEDGEKTEEKEVK